MRRSRSAMPPSLLPLRHVAPERGYDLRRDLYHQTPVRPVFALMRTYTCVVSIWHLVQCVVMVSLHAPYVSVRCPSDKSIVVSATNMMPLHTARSTIRGYLRGSVLVFAFPGAWRPWSSSTSSL